MPLLFFTFKTIGCLAVVYLFYQFVLRRLTFYNWNRWYLLGYTHYLSFFIPFINITPILESNMVLDMRIIQLDARCSSIYNSILEEAYIDPAPNGQPVMINGI